MPFRRTCQQRARAMVAAGVALAPLFLVSCKGSPTAPIPPEPPPAPNCTYQLAASTEPILPEGGTSTITVTTGAQCSWTARADAEWITITSGASGTGPGTIALTASANADPAAREAGITVADQSVRVRQRGRTACEYRVTPDYQAFGPEGGTGNLAIETAAGCAWTADPNVAWVALSTTSGAGSANISYTVAANPETGTAEREAVIRVAGRVVYVRQGPRGRACEYSVNPLEFVLHWHEQGGTTRVTTDAGCRWTVRSGAGWITVSGDEEREGPGEITFTSADYIGEPTRRAPVEVRWPTASAGQNVWLSQEGCRYAIAEETKVIPHNGGSFQLFVLGTPVSVDCRQGCPWAATTSVPWIHIAHPNGVGEDMLFYTADPNPGGQRFGQITVAGRTLTITQP